MCCVCCGFFFFGLCDFGSGFCWLLLVLRLGGPIGLGLGVPVVGFLCWGCRLWLGGCSKTRRHGLHILLFGSFAKALEESAWLPETLSVWSLGPRSRSGTQKTGGDLKTLFGFCIRKRPRSSALSFTGTSARVGRPSLSSASHGGSGQAGRQSCEDCGPTFHVPDLGSHRESPQLLKLGRGKVLQGLKQTVLVQGHQLRSQGTCSRVCIHSPARRA